MWDLVKEDEFSKRTKKIVKKHRTEVRNCVDNLAAYFADLKSGLLPQQIIRGYVHNDYPKGIKSLDQKGPGVTNKEIRLYIYPDEENEDLIAITIGDKDSQSNDVKTCVDYVETLISDRENSKETGY